MEIRVSVTAYVAARIAAARQLQSLLPQDALDKKEGGYQNVSVIRANSMKHMPNFFAKGQVSYIPCMSINCSKERWSGCRADQVANEDVLPLPRSTFQSPQTKSSNHHVRFSPFHHVSFQLKLFRTSLLAEYAYVLRPGGILYTVTDVKGESSVPVSTPVSVPVPVPSCSYPSLDPLLPQSG